jgi:hypothetical protein
MGFGQNELADLSTTSQRSTTIASSRACVRAKHEVMARHQVVAAVREPGLHER